MESDREDHINQSQAPHHAPLVVSLFFGTIFTCLGIVMAYRGFLLILQREADPAGISLLSFAALLFGSIGILILYGVVFRSRYKDARESFSTLREQWEKGKIICSTRVVTIALALLFVISLLSLSASYYVLYQDFLEEKYSNFWWLLSLVPLSYLTFLLLRSWLRYSKYGESICELPQGPGAIGGEINLIIRAPSRFITTGDFTGILMCKTAVVPDQGRTRCKDAVLWQEEKTISGHGVSASCGINFRFSLPADMPAADQAGAHARIKWIFTVTAATEGIDYKAQFQVPVY